MRGSVTEAVVEKAALGWLAALGWQVAHGPDIAPETPGAEWGDYGLESLVGFVVVYSERSHEPTQ